MKKVRVGLLIFAGICVAAWFIMSSAILFDHPGAAVFIPVLLGALSLLVAATLGLRKGKAWWRIVLCILVMLLTAYLIYTGIWGYFHWEATASPTFTPM